MSERHEDGSIDPLIKRRVGEGRGAGRLKDYRPWVRTGDFGSRGFAFRINGWKTERAHHLMSRIEFHFFLLLEWSLGVLDIREQYPLLPISETLSIAEQLGVRHPTHPKTRNPTVVTTDFIITLQGKLESGEVARSIKQSTELASHRTQEKLAIEREFLAARGINWAVVTELEIPKVVSENVHWVHPYRNLNDHDFPPSTVERVRDMLLTKLASTNRRLSELTSECDDTIGLESGGSLVIVRHLIATRQLLVDMTEPILAGQPLKVLQSEINHETVSKCAA